FGADGQAVPAGAQVNIQRASDVVRVSGQEVDGAPRLLVEVGVRGDEHAVVAGVQAHVGHRDAAGHCISVAARGRALDVEHLAARAGRDVDPLEAVVVDPVHSGRHRHGPAGGQACAVHSQRVQARAAVEPTQRTLEVQEIDVEVAVLVPVAARVAVDGDVDLGREVQPD